MYTTSMKALGQTLPQKTTFQMTTKWGWRSNLIIALPKRPFIAKLKLEWKQEAFNLNLILKDYKLRSGSLLAPVHVP